MSEIKELKEEIRKLAEGMYRGFEEVNRRFEDMNDEFKAVRVEMEHESGELKEMIRGMDDRLKNVEHIAGERWNIRDFSDRLEAVESYIKSNAG